MSGRRRRFESLWDTKEVDVPPADISGNVPLPGKETSPKWSNSEANDVVMSDDITEQFSWDPLPGNGNMPKDDDIGKDNRTTQTDPDFDEPRNQSSARPSDDMPYRGRDRGVGGTGNVSRDRGRSRSRSPKRSSSSRGNTRGTARSRSRSRDRENSGGSRHEDNRNSTEVSRNRFPDHHDRGDRNAYDDQDRKRQSRRNSGVPCRFFAIGKCSRNDCKFSHDVPETGGYDGRSHDLNFDDKNKSRNGPPGGFERRSGVDFHGQTLDDKIRTRSKDPKSNKNIDRKRKSWDEVGVSDTTSKVTMDVQKPQLVADGLRVPSSLNETKQTQLFNGKPVKASETGVPQVTNAINSQLVPQVTSLPTSLPSPGQLPQAYTELNLTNALGLLYSLPVSASSGPTAVQQNLDIQSKEQYEVKGTVPMDNSADPNSRKLGETGGLVEEHGKSSKSKKQERVGNAEGNESRLGENSNPGNSEAQGKAEEVNMSSDEKAMRLFKIALVDFVKEILKPTWKEGKMSREVHKTIVKKVVDKVTSTIQGVQIPRTQERIDQYLVFSKSKITKLIEAYVERSLKA